MVLQLGIGIKMNAYSFLEVDLKPLGYKNGHIDPKVLKFHYTKSPIFLGYLGIPKDNAK